jgi:hypothetical protein
MSTVIGTAYATGENTVTSKSYVDTQDALKQDKITAGTTGTVVTYNGTTNGQAQFSEKGIYSGAATYSNSDADKLVTAGVVHNMAETLETLTVPDNKLTCYNSPDCTLWTITSGTASLATQGTFAPLTAAPAPACKTYGDAITTSPSECCSGTQQTCGRGHTCYCGCANDTDCPSGKTCDGSNICL